MTDEENPVEENPLLEKPVMSNLLTLLSLEVLFYDF